MLEAQGFIAVTSAGGAATFRKEWVEKLQHIPQIYLCYDRDEAGRKGALKVGQLLPQAKLAELPSEVGTGGDVTDFFVRLGRSREDFIELLKHAEPIPQPEVPVIQVDQPKDNAAHASVRRRIDYIKQDIAIGDVIGRYVQLRPSGDRLVGRCPFHTDHEPSFVVYPATRSFHCYGCGKHGDVIDFVQKHEHITLSQALNILDSVQRYHGQNSQPAH